MKRATLLLLLLILVIVAAFRGGIFDVVQPVLDHGATVEGQQGAPRGQVDSPKAATRHARVSSSKADAATWGVVVDAKGRQVAGATVFWVDARVHTEFAREVEFIDVASRSSWSAGSRPQGLRSVVSGDNGRYEFDRSPEMRRDATHVCAWHPMHGGSVVALSPRAPPHRRITLYSGARIKGWVYSPYGMPASGYSGYVAIYVPGRAAPMVKVGVRRDGFFITPALPVGRAYTVFAQEGEFESSETATVELAASGAEVRIAIVVAQECDVVLCRASGEQWTWEALADATGVPTSLLKSGKYSVGEYGQKRDVSAVEKSKVVRMRVAAARGQVGQPNSLLVLWARDTVIGSGKVVPRRAGDAEGVELVFTALRAFRQVRVEVSGVLLSPDADSQLAVRAAHVVFTGPIRVSTAEVVSSSSSFPLSFETTALPSDRHIDVYIKADGCAGRLYSVPIIGGVGSVRVVLDKLAGKATLEVSRDCNQYKRLTACRTNAAGAFPDLPRKSRAQRDGEKLIWGSLSDREHDVVVWSPGLAPRGASIRPRVAQKLKLRRGRVVAIVNNIRQPIRLIARDSSGRVFWSDRLWGVTRVSGRMSMRVDPDVASLEARSMDCTKVLAHRELRDGVNTVVF